MRGCSERFRAHVWATPCWRLHEAERGHQRQKRPRGPASRPNTTDAVDCQGSKLRPWIRNTTQGVPPHQTPWCASNPWCASMQVRHLPESALKADAASCQPHSRSGTGRPGTGSKQGPRPSAAASGLLGHQPGHQSGHPAAPVRCRCSPSAPVQRACARSPCSQHSVQPRHICCAHFSSERDDDVVAQAP